MNQTSGEFRAKDTDGDVLFLIEAFFRLSPLVIFVAVAADADGAFVLATPAVAAAADAVATADAFAAEN